MDVIPSFEVLPSLMSSFNDVIMIVIASRMLSRCSFSLSPDVAMRCPLKSHSNVCGLRSQM